MAQLGSAPALGAGGREFESPFPDQLSSTFTEFQQSPKGAASAKIYPVNAGAIGVVGVEVVVVGAIGSDCHATSSYSSVPVMAAEGFEPSAFIV